MFFLLPIGHESQTVQRLPWVTFSLIATCILAFIYTSVIGAPDEEEINRKATEFFEYFEEKPYLEVPPGMADYLSPDEYEYLDTLREGIDRTWLNSDVVRSEQEILNQRAQEFLAEVNNDPLRRWGYIPKDSGFVPLIACIFLHVGFWHLFGNMLFLFLAGCSIEDLWGRPLYFGFYILSGVAATLVHELKFPDSAVPLVGASGAIAGLMGAFLVRLARIKIRFFYFIWLLGFRFGTFQAPAFIMLPLWLGQQVLYAAITDESAGVAFWAHIGGFAFGAIFAGVMKAGGYEEKYIAPSIEKKVSLAQNPQFLEAMELSERGEYPQALVLLQKVVRQEPNHLEAYMEMRRIAEISGDADGYTGNTAGILDVYLRGRDTEMILTHSDQLRLSPLAKTLPVKTLFGLGTFFDEQRDDASAVHFLEQLVTKYPDDPLSMKANSKLARIFLERMNDRDRGVAAFYKAFEHPLADSQWKSAMQLDRKRYQIDVSSAPAAMTQPVPTVSFVSPTSATFVNPQPPAQTAPSNMMAASTPGVLPEEEFDGKYSSWTVVGCRVDKITLKGLSLSNVNQRTALLPWKRIQMLSVGRIRSFSSGAPGSHESLLLDMIVPVPDGIIVYRTTGKTLDFARLFPRLEQSFSDAFENFIGILLRNSGARCFPDRAHCVGPVFQEYPDIAIYEKRLRITV